MKELKLYFKLFKLQMLSSLEYRGWWMSALQALLYCVLDPVGMIFLFVRFGSIGEWTMERILLIYAMAVTSYGLALLFCQGFDRFPASFVRTGDFDRLLLRPKSLFIQTAASAFYIHRISRPAAGIGVIFWCLWRLGAPLSPLNILLLLLALLGGFFVYFGVFVMSAGIAFFTIKALDWVVVFTNASYQVTRIPYEYLPGAIKAVFTFLMPMLIICYFPASVICGWGEPLWAALLALPAGLLFFAAAVLIWRIGVRRYTSTGS